MSDSPEKKTKEHSDSEKTWVKFEEGANGNGEGPAVINADTIQVKVRTENTDIHHIPDGSSPSKGRILRTQNSSAVTNPSSQLVQLSATQLHNVPLSDPNVQTDSNAQGIIRQGFVNGDVIVTLLPQNPQGFAMPWITPAKFRPELVPEELMAQGLTLTVEDYVHIMSQLVNDYRFTLYNIFYKRVLIIWIFLAFVILMAILFSGLRQLELFGAGIAWLFVNASAIFMCMWIKIQSKLQQLMEEEERNGQTVNRAEAKIAQSLCHRMDVDDSDIIIAGATNTRISRQQAPSWRLWGEEQCKGAIYMVYLKKVRYHHPSRSITQQDSDDEISHLEWETVRVKFLKAGTLERLIESLSSDSGELESTFVNVFLATYRTFASGAQVLNLILDRYLALCSENKVNLPAHLREHHKKAIRLTLQVWLDAYLEDFKDYPFYTALNQLHDFCQKNLPDSDLCIKVGYKLEKLRRDEESKGLSEENNVLLKSSSLTNGTHSPYRFLNIDVVLFAQQLTRMDTVLFKNVIAHQCLGSVWARRDRGKGDLAATVVATVDQFNAVSYRVQSTILHDTELRPSQRAKLIAKWVDIAQELRMLKNFSSLKAIISGLQSNPIYRLKKSWAAVSRDKLELFEELARIFSEENNQLNQRELLMKEGTAKHAETAHSGDRHLPKAMGKLAINSLSVSHGTIPYLGTFLTDLTMIDTAIADTVGDGLVNFDKKRKEFEVLAQIRLLQGAANAYRFEVDESFARWWESLSLLDEKEMWQMSCLIEPLATTRESKMKKRPQFSHRKNDSIASTSSGSSCSQFFLDSDSLNTTSHNDSCSLERKMSTSSSSSLPSLDVSIQSTGTTASGQTPERSLGSVGSPQQPTSSPYINPDYYIIRVSLENDSHEVEGVNMYKCIMLSNSERTSSVIQNAMGKHSIEGNADDYTLAQLLPDGGEMILPATANVYYAINTSIDLNFVLRRRRHGDENTIIRRNPTKDHKARKKLLPLLS